MTTLSTVRRKLGRRAAAVTLATAATVIMGGGSAFAANDVFVDFDVNGATHIAKPNSDIALGPAVMYATAAEDGSFTGDMALPGTRTEFKIAGFLPVTANVNFIPTKPTTGQITRVGRYRTLATSSSYYVRLSNIRAAGLPLFAGPFCRTKAPVVIDASTPAGEYFTVASGGRLTGAYTIGDFQHCGLNTLLINSLVPDSGNTIELNLTGGRPR